MRITIFVLSMFLGVACSPKKNKSTSTNSEKSSEDAKQGVTADALVVSDSKGVIEGKFDSKTKIPQKLLASVDSSLKGSSITVPPGAFAIDTNIQLEEARSIATQSGAIKLGIDSKDVQIASSAMSMASDQKIDSDKEITVSLNVGDSQSSLALAGEQYYVVFYHVWKQSLGKYIYGVIITKDLSVTASHVAFKTKFFGTYQLASIDVSLKKALELATSIPIDKNQASSPKAPIVGNEVVKETTDPLGEEEVTPTVAATLVSVRFSESSFYVMPGSTGSLRLEAVYSDNSVVNVSDSASWDVSESNELTTSGPASGSLSISGVSVGSTSITASYSGKSATTVASVATIGASMPDNYAEVGYQNPIYWSLDGIDSNLNIYYAFRPVETTGALVWFNNDTCMGDLNGIELVSEMASWNPVGCDTSSEYDYFIKIESADHPQIFGISNAIYVGVPN
jgi:hypothetical protein